jgi:hypothetical protein
MVSRQCFESDRQTFIDAHGGRDAARRLYVTKNGQRVETDYYVFPDGAKLSWHPLGENYPPPQDEVERWQLILEYRRIMLAEAKQAIKDFENQVMAHFDPNFRGTYCGPNYAGSREEALEELKQKKRSIWNRQHAVEVIEEALEAVLNTGAKSAREERLQLEQLMRQRKFMDAFNDIKV